MNRAQELNDRLWTLEAETAWEPQDIQDPRGGYRVLSRYLVGVLNTICSVFPEVESAYAAISGTKPSVFTPLAAVGRKLEDIPISHQNEPNTLVSRILLSPAADAVEYIEDVRKDPLFKGAGAARSKIVIRLVGYGELFGFISLDTNNPGTFSSGLAAELALSQPALSRALAESTFSMRLWEVALPFDELMGDLSSLYASIVSRTLLAFAACGAVLRVYDSVGHRLPAVEVSETAIEDQPIYEYLLDDDAPDEAVALQVFTSTEHRWAVAMSEGDSDLQISGAQLTAASRQALQASGIQSYCVFRLEPEAPSATKRALGTLAFFHRHTRRFSWRDIALASSLAQRSADIIETYANHSALKDAHEKVLLESQMLTRVEVVSLLAHDLGHKALAIKNNFDIFCNNVRKAIRDRRPYDSLEASRCSTDTSIDSSLRALRTVNTLFHDGHERSRSTTFSVRDAVEEVFVTMEDALKRNDCYPPDINVPGSLTVYGNRSILVQVIFNLVINTIEAQRARKNPRKNVLHVHASKEGVGASSRLLLKFWDEGPGIDQRRFSPPERIFELGETSKDGGTGRGLPISRDLLNAYFGGDMSLLDPAKALFRITIPETRE